MTIEQIKSYQIGSLPYNERTRQVMQYLMEMSMQYTPEEWVACTDPRRSFSLFNDLEIDDDIPTAQLVEEPNEP